MSEKLKFTNTRNKQLTDEERAFYAECGRRGGQKVAQEYGSAHMAAIGAQGHTGATRTAKPKNARKPVKTLTPVVDTSLDEFI
jgi:hypothetical protein